MKESPGAFQTRTGLDYCPPPWLAALAEPLAPDAACPTLFRYPGPEGTLAHLRGGMRRLAPTERRWVWLSETGPGAGSAWEHFGVVAVLEPLRLSPCVAGEPGAFLGINAALSSVPTVWVPPSAVTASIPWDDIGRPEEAIEAFGVDYHATRAEMVDALQGYLEEVAGLGQEAPTAVPWHAVPPAERASLLERSGVPRRWTP